MRSTRLVGTPAVFMCVALLVVSASVVARPKQNAHGANQPNNNATADGLVVYSAGLDGILVDPKDAALAKALGMVIDRIGELPRELGQPPIAAVGGQFVLELLTRPLTLRVGMLEEEAQAGNGLPIYMQLSFFARDAQHAEELAGHFAGVAAFALPGPSRPVPNKSGMRQAQLDDGVTMYYGPIEIGGQPAFVLAINRLLDEPLELGAMGLPQGIEPVLALRYDAQQMQPLLEMAIEQAKGDPEAEATRKQLELMGLLGPDAGRFEFGMGYGDDRAYAVLHCENYRQFMKRVGLLPSGPLTPDDLRGIPADATYAQISRYNIAGLGQMLNNTLPEEMREQDPFAILEMRTGVHLQRDILDHLGERTAVYMSDSTGGGGLLSIAGFVEVTNPDALNQTITRITAAANQMAKQHAKGYVRFAERTIEDLSITVLSFPGLPIPLELSFALTDGHLFAAASPQGLMAAANQMRNGRNDLTDNPQFREMIAQQSMNNAIQITFANTPRLLRSGYGLMSMGAAALSNAVRSPNNHARDPGLIMPPFHELAANAKATVTVASFHDDDLVTTWTFDRSWLVNLTGSAGAFGGATSAVAATGLVTGLTLPALGKARETARATRSMTQLRSLHMAINMYEQEQGKMPGNLQALVQKNFITDDMLSSPFGPAADGGSDYWFDLTQSPGTVKRPDQQVVGYDRSMYAQHRTVAVVFHDGHVTQMSAWEFRSLINSEPNNKIDFDLPFDD